MRLVEVEVRLQVSGLEQLVEVLAIAVEMAQRTAVVGVAVAVALLMFAKDTTRPVLMLSWPGVGQ